MLFLLKKRRGFEPSVSEEAENHGTKADYERRDMPVTCLSEEGPLSETISIRFAWANPSFSVQQSYSDEAV